MITNILANLCYSFKVNVIKIYVINNEFVVKYCFRRFPIIIRNIIYIYK